MNYLFRSLALLLISLSSFQHTHAHNPPDSTAWKLLTKSKLFFAQSSYGQYWKGTGQNSLELGTSIDFRAKRTRNGRTWEHKALVRYGMIKLGGHSFQKNEDQLRLESKFSKKVSNNLKVSGLVSAQTHLYDFYALDKNGAQANQIGGFLAPGLFHLGSGIDMSSKSEAIRIFYTPINSKLTVVRNKNLRAQFLPESVANKGVRYEFGSLLKVQLKKELVQNIVFESTGSFFTSHLQNFGNFDVDIEGNLNFKVNKYFEVSLRTHLIYDEDIQFKVIDEEGEPTAQVGPRTQFKEVLHIGMSHTF